MSARQGFLQRIHARLHADERGFSMIESMVAGMVLAIGAFAVAQSLSYGLDSTGLARQRLEAQTAAEQISELARSVNYDNLVIDQDSGDPPIAHNTDPENPDYYINTAGDEYDPSGTGSFEPLIVAENPAHPELKHFQSPFVQGNSEFEVYLYITWVDSPLDGLVPADDPDGNSSGDGGGGTVGDEDGHDQKRVTVVVTWQYGPASGVRQLKTSTIFSDGEVPYHDSSDEAANDPPVVTCPTTSATGLTVDFVAQATDADGSIVRVDWEFGDGDTLDDGGTTLSHTYPGPGTYTVANTVFDNLGATASNAGQNCQVVVTSGGGGPPGPDGTVVIAGGASHATQTQVTLTLSSVGATEMQFSDDGVSWTALQAYATSAIYTLSSGDGTKTVYARFVDSSGNDGNPATDTIILDTGAPAGPTNLVINRAANKKSADLSWSAPSPLPSDFAGYQVWRRPTTVGVFTLISCAMQTPTSCVDSPLTASTSYEYYIVTVDTAGNQSAQSNHVTI